MANRTIKDHILLINYNRLENVLEIIKELRSDKSTSNNDISLIDEPLTELPAALRQKNVHFVNGNPTREATLIQANAGEAKYAIILSKDPDDPRDGKQILNFTPDHRILSSAKAIIIAKERLEAIATL